VHENEGLAHKYSVPMAQAPGDHPGDVKISGVL